MKKLLAFLLFAYTGIALAQDGTSSQLSAAQVQARVRSVSSGTGFSVFDLSSSIPWITIGTGHCESSSSDECSMVISSDVVAETLGLFGPRRGSSPAVASFRALFPDDLAAGGADTNCLKQSGGVFTWGVCSAAAGIGTDTFWAAKGDLAGGTANDTAGVLTVGTNDYILMAESGETTGLKWNAPATTSELADVTTGAESAGTSDTYARGDHVHHITLTKVANFPIGFPGSAENAGGWYFPVAATITEFRCVLVGSSSPSVTPNVKFGTDRSAAGTSVTTAPAACTNTTTGATQTLNNTAVSAGSYMWAITTAQSGNVSWAILSVTYTEP